MKPIVENYTSFVLGLIEQAGIESVLEIGIGPDAYTSKRILESTIDKKLDLYMIDIELNPIAQSELKDFGGKYNLIIGSSTLDQSFDNIPACELVLIDGDHSFQGVLNDIRKVIHLKKITPNGFLIFHDTNSQQIAEAIDISSKAHSFGYVNFTDLNLAIARF